MELDSKERLQNTIGHLNNKIKELEVKGKTLTRKIV